jgi:hypothetical protein
MASKSATAAASLPDLSSSSSTAAAATNVSRCLQAIVLSPLLLVFVVGAVEVFPDLSFRNAWMGVLRRRRQQTGEEAPPPRGALRRIIDRPPEETESERGRIPAGRWWWWRRQFRRHRRRAEWVSFVRMLSLAVHQVIVTVAFSRIWGDDDGDDKNNGSSNGNNGSSNNNNERDSSSNGYSNSEWALRFSAILLLVVGADAYAARRHRHFWIAAWELPFAIIWSVRALGETFGRLSAFETWADDRKYWEGGDVEDRRPRLPSGTPAALPVHVKTAAAAARPGFWITQHPLAALAVAVEQACLILGVVVMVAALDRLLSLHEMFTAFLASRHGRDHGVGGGGGGGDSNSNSTESALRRVYRITRQFDASPTGTADEYQIDDDPHQLTQEIADRVFEMFEEAGEEHSQVAVWLGTHACLCNFAPPLPDPAGRTGRVPSAVALESVCTELLPMVGGRLLHVYVPMAASTRGDDDGPDSIENACSGSIVASMDAFFHLRVLHDCGENGVIQVGRDVNFAGRFPVSRRGLHALAKDPNPNERSNRNRQRCLDLDRLGLAEDQWGCLLRSCDGPSVKVSFSGGGYDQQPGSIRALIQALTENECRAHVCVFDVLSLPGDVLVDFAAALERNSSLKDLTLSICCRDPWTGNLDLVAARDAGDIVATTIFECLARRNAPVDVLDLSLPVSSSLVRNRLWYEVVPAAGLNLKRLVLRTGAGIDPRAPPAEYNVEEEERMIRAVSASTSLCTFDYKDWDIPSNNNEYLERIEMAARPFLRFNRFRRLALKMEHEPSAALQKRWFASTLRRSVACNEPAWCCFLLKRNAAGFHECIDARRTVQLQRHRADVA